MKVKNISGGDITANFSVVYADETFEIPADNFPALVAEYKPEFFKVIDGAASEQEAEEAPGSFIVGDIPPVRVGRPKKTV
jgi:hypothetical protein